MEPWIGGGIFGLLSLFSGQLFARQRAIDRERAAHVKELADHDRHVSEDREALLVELREMRAEMAALQRRLNEALDDR